MGAGSGPAVPVLPSAGVGKGWQPLLLEGAALQAGGASTVAEVGTGTPIPASHRVLGAACGPGDVSMCLVGRGPSRAGRGRLMGPSPMGSLIIEWLQRDCPDGTHLMGDSFQWDALNGTPL